MSEKSKKRKIVFTPDNTLRAQYEFATISPEVCRHPALIGGYGSGKTRAIPLRWVSLIEWRGRHQKKACHMMIVEPTFEMIRDVLIPTMDSFFDEFGIKHTLQKSYNYYTIRYRNLDFTVLMRSFSKPSSLTGKNLTDVIIDEFDKENNQQNQEFIWNECITRVREAEYGTVAITTTPEGHRYTYTLYKEKNRDNPNFKLIKAKTTENKFLPPDYIQNLYEQYDSLMVQRYINGEFVSINGLQAYYAFQPRHISGIAKDDPKKPIWVGIDFNVNPMTAVLMQPQEDGSVSIFDEFFIPNSNTYKLTEAILHFYSGRIINACPDMTGKARKTSADMSDIQILQKAGFNIYGQGVLPERTRLNIVNNLFDKGLVYINPKCKNLIRGLETVQVNDYGQIDKSESGRKWTDITDAMSYGLIRCTHKTPKWQGY